MVQVTLARALPTTLSPPYRNVLIPYLPGQQVPWRRIFNIFRQSASGATLWYKLVWLACCQPRSARPTWMFWSHIYGDSMSLVAEFLTYSHRARPVLPYGTSYFGSRASNPAQPPPTGMFWSHIYGDSKSLGAEFLTYSDRARPVLPYGTSYFGSRASNPAQPTLRECFDPIFTGTASPLAPNF